MTAEGLAPASAPIVEDYNAPMTPTSCPEAERAAKAMARKLGWLEEPLLGSTENE